MAVFILKNTLKKSVFPGKLFRKIMKNYFSPFSFCYAYSSKSYASNYTKHGYIFFIYDRANKDLKFAKIIWMLGSLEGLPALFCRPKQLKKLYFIFFYIYFTRGYFLPDGDSKIFPKNVHFCFNTFSYGLLLTYIFISSTTISKPKVLHFLNKSLEF